MAQYRDSGERLGGVGGRQTWPVVDLFVYAPRCVEIQVRPSRGWWLSRTGAERTQVREHRKRRRPPSAGRPHLNISVAYPRCRLTSKTKPTPCFFVAGPSIVVSAPP